MDDRRERTARFRRLLAAPIEAVRESALAVILTGSRARGDDREGSDHDLVLVVATTGRLAPVGARFRRNVPRGVWADVFPVTARALEIDLSDALRSGRDPDGALRAVRDGIPLHGDAFVAALRERHAAGLAATAGLFRLPSLLPDVRDGLAAHERRLLCTLASLGITSRAKHRKSAVVVEECAATLHPFSRTMLYETLVRMTAPWRSRTPLIDPQGNFGSVDGDPPAGRRYTEVRPSAFCAALLDDPSLELTPRVPCTPPGWETRLMGIEEPTYLPARLPACLLGGWCDPRSDAGPVLPPYNLGEICDAITALLDDPGLTTDALLRIVPGPDLPTGGEVLGRAGARAAIRTGRGKVRVRRKAPAPREVTLDVEQRLLVDGAPRVLPLLEILRLFVAEREAVIARRAAIEVVRLEERRAAVDALLACAADLDRVAAALRASGSLDDARDALGAAFGWTPAQVAHVLRSGLTGLTRDRSAALAAERAALAADLRTCRAALRGRAGVRKIMREETMRLKRDHGVERGTVLTAGG